MSDRWSILELSRVCRARKDGLTYRQIRDKWFPGKSVEAVRSATRTQKYEEVERSLKWNPQAFQPDDLPHTFHFPQIDVEFSAERFADLVRSYVSDGKNLTRAQVAREFGITEDQMDHICQTYGLTKDSPFLPPELLASLDDSEVIERALDARAENVKERVERTRAKYFEREYRKLLKKYQNREVTVERVDEMLAKRSDKFGARDVPKPKTSEIVIPSVHAPTADIHAGKLSWSQEVGYDYDTYIAADRQRAHGEWVAGRLVDNPVKTAYVTDVGDFFHAILSETESGTALDKDTRDLKVFDEMFEAKVDQIDAIRQVAERVVVLGVPGNHDHIFAQLFQRMLGLHYDGVPDVDVRPVYGRFAGFMAGNTAHLLDHGKGVRSLNGWKAKAQVETVEKYVLDGRRAKHRVYYVGHLHELQVAEHTNTELRRLMPMCDPDDYEMGMRYEGVPGAELFHLDEQGEIVTIDRFRPNRTK